MKDDFKDLEYHELDTEKFPDIKEGRIYIAETAEKPVEWIDELNTYTADLLNKEEYKNKSNKDNLLPVFSMINLAQVYDNIKNLGYNCSILPIEQCVSVTLSTVEKRILKWIERNPFEDLTAEEIMNKIPNNIEITKVDLKKYLEDFEKKLKILKSTKSGKSKKFSYNNE